MSRDTVRIVHNDAELVVWAMADYPRVGEQVRIDGDWYEIDHLFYDGDWKAHESRPTVVCEVVAL